MKTLELLAPARNADIGIAAIDCGADAVYMAGPAFGARKDAANSIEEVARVCAHAHAFGARVFLTVNTMMRDEEMEEVHMIMLKAQDEARVDAFIVQDLRLLSFSDIHIPIHASTQCTVLSEERARFLEKEAGVGRIVLERELSLEQIRSICGAVSCEVEAFVHGALCVCYSGQCYLSEVLTGRSANRGECIQACRSLYDLEDAQGKVLVKDKALLSLKDLNLLTRLEDLADAGVTSFKIEGRLKNISYVRNAVMAYSEALDTLVASRPDDLRRASFGHVSGGVTPSLSKTFNRGYTTLFLDGERGKWSSMDAPKGMGESIGSIGRIRREGKGMVITVKPKAAAGGTLTFSNGDGFSVITRGGIAGFRGDVCEGLSIRCKAVDGIREGDRIFRNFDASFEKQLESQVCRRELGASVEVRIKKGFDMEFVATSEDGRTVVCPFSGDMDAADNIERQLALFREQLSKRAGAFCFTVSDIKVEGTKVPLLSASILNSIRRLIASDLESVPLKPVEMCHGLRQGGMDITDPVSHEALRELMRTKYCIRYELGMCPVHQGAGDSGDLFLVNQGRRFPLHFDCARCEMTVLREA